MEPTLLALAKFIRCIAAGMIVPTVIVLLLAANPPHLSGQDPELRVTLDVEDGNADALVVTREEPEDEGFGRQKAMIASLTIFVLAIFVGFELITKVPPTLHTPLMSGSNAISGITLIGAIIIAGVGSSGLAIVLGLLAVVLATINVVGGFLVTHRMLAMFKRK